MKIIRTITDILIGVSIGSGLALTILGLTIIMLSLGGCTNFKATMPDGTELIYQRVMTISSAKKAELYYVDPNSNTVLWVVLDDPNSRVNPGGFKIKEPRTGIEASGYAN